MTLENALRLPDNLCDRLDRALKYSFHAMPPGKPWPGFRYATASRRTRQGVRMNGAGEGFEETNHQQPKVSVELPRSLGLKTIRRLGAKCLAALAR